MTYTGEVQVGGDADVRELADLVITKLAVGEYSNNAYLLRCTHTGAQVLIDAAAEPDRLLHLIGEGGLDAIVAGPESGCGPARDRVRPDHEQRGARGVLVHSLQKVLEHVDLVAFVVDGGDPARERARKIGRAHV